MLNFDYCVYTYLHRKEMIFKINRLIKNEDDKKALFERAKIHDMDKMTLYLIWSKEKASKYHKETAPHHIENNLPKTRLDKLEAIIDYESAGTKEDKNFNAYDTIRIYMPEHQAELMPLLKDLKIDYSYPNTNDKELIDYIQQFLPVTEEQILTEVMEYLINNPNNVLTLIKEKEPD